MEPGMILWVRNTKWQIRKQEKRENSNGDKKKIEKFKKQFMGERW